MGDKPKGLYTSNGFSTKTPSQDELNLDNLFFPSEPADPNAVTYIPRPDLEEKVLEAIREKRAVILYGGMSSGKTTISLNVLNRLDTAVDAFQLGRRDQGLIRESFYDVPIDFHQLKYETEVTEAHTNEKELRGYFNLRLLNFLSRVLPNAEAGASAHRAVKGEEGNKNELVVQSPTKHKKLDHLNDIQAVFIIDDFNDIQTCDQDFLKSIIKEISDKKMKFPKIIIGTNRDNPEEIIGKDPSITRVISTIYIPPFTDKECEVIVDRGLKIANIKCDKGFSPKVASITAGAPSLTHLFTWKLAKYSLTRNRKVDSTDLQIVTRDWLDNDGAIFRNQIGSFAAKSGSQSCKVVILKELASRKEQEVTEEDLAAAIADQPPGMFKARTVKNNLRDLSNEDEPIIVRYPKVIAGRRQMTTRFTAPEFKAVFRMLEQDH